MKAVKEIKDRVKSETPTHFKQVRNLGVLVLFTGIAIKVVSAFIPDVAISLEGIASELITAGLTAAGLSQTAKK